MEASSFDDPCTRLRPSISIQNPSVSIPERRISGVPA